MLEQPSLKFLVLDIENFLSEWEPAIYNSLYILQQAMHNRKSEAEFLQHNGVLYISRFVAEKSLNRQFQEKQNAKVVLTPLKGAGRCRLSIKDVGQADTIFFAQDAPRKDTLRPGFLEIHVKCVGLNAKVRPSG